MVSAILSAANSEPRGWENRSAMMVSMASFFLIGGGEKSFPQRFISCLLNDILLRFQHVF